SESMAVEDDDPPRFPDYLPAHRCCPDRGVRKLSKIPCCGVLEASHTCRKYMIMNIISTTSPAAMRFSPVNSPFSREEIVIDRMRRRTTAQWRERLDAF